MSALPADPVAPLGLCGFADLFRKGEITSEGATGAYLERIARLDGKLGAYQHVAAGQALATAKAMDGLWRAGVDLGPLMGVPVAVKDLLVVEGMPTTAGTRMPLEGLLAPEEGAFVQALRRAGCVILGKTKTVEFAFGITGASGSLGTPWNPWDLEVHRLPGGSSSGAAVAMAAGLCALSIGSDTGGSVRVPAALNGLFGLKVTAGRWPNEGAVALAPALDTLGLLAATARDGAFAYGAINRALGQERDKRDQAIAPARLTALTFGRPANSFFENLAAEVAVTFDAALGQAARAGVAVTDFLLPEAPECEAYFPVSLPVNLLAVLGRERFEAHRHLIDPVIRLGIESGMNIKASDYLALERKRLNSVRQGRKRFRRFDAWVSPTIASTALTLADLADAGAAIPFALAMTQNTQPANYLDLCAATIALPRKEGRLPIGFQVMCPAGAETRLLSISLALEELFGRAGMPDVEAAVL